MDIKAVSKRRTFKQYFESVGGSGWVLVQAVPQISLCTSLIKNRDEQRGLSKKSTNSQCKILGHLEEIKPVIHILKYKI